jgi:hypothetical protein
MNPPRDPTQVPPNLKEDVGKHNETDFNDDAPNESDFGEDDDPNAIIEDDDE